MSLSDSLNSPPPARRPRADVPRGFEPGVKYEANQPVEAVVQVAEIPENEQAWRAEIQRVTGHEIPAHRAVELTDTRYWGDPQQPNIYCKFKITDRAQPVNLDIEDLINAAKAASGRPPTARRKGRALVVAWADLQVGKVGSRGGTEELIKRVFAKLDSLDHYADQLGCETAYLVDVGDCVESFENVASQSFTNDLSFPEQLRVARRLFTEAAVRLAKTHPSVICTSVPSNHGQWRRGKDQLGRPVDDFGIENLVSTADAFSLNPDALGHVSFLVPELWQETVALNVHGTILAVAHGHQATRPERIPDWWARQVHGGQPGADADILLTGHFHHLRVQPSGRSAHTGRAKWWIQAPTLDNGSDWYRLKNGDDSDPALLTFVVDADGWSQLKLL